MKANIYNRILKAALLFIIAATLFGMTASLTNAQSRSMTDGKKKSMKRVYKCKQVGTQKVAVKKFSKKELAEYLAGKEAKKLPRVSDTSAETSGISETTFIAEVKRIEEKEIRETNLPLPKPVYFKFDKDELTYKDLHQIALAVEHARQGKYIIIEGHTDSYGSNEYNLALSLKRANRIKEMMIEMGGVNAEAISVRHYGEERPAISNDTHENRQLNRRVEFVVLQY